MSEPKKLVVMISSTTKDLAEHRTMVLEACRRVGLDVSRMEELPALDKDAAEISVAMVRQADVYIGVFAHRYGYVPDGSDISVIEMEYKEAVANKIPRLCFLIDEDLPVSPKMMDIGLAGEKLKAFKDRVSKDRVVGFFTTAKELRGLVIHALETFKADRVNPDEPKPIPSLHFVHPIPKPPEPYIAHYYALLQTGKIIGRRAELDRLTQWITKSPYPMMHVVAIGGMGKSALTWHWFHHIAPQEWPKMKGRIWWSFYESDGHFENFVTRSLAYVSGQSEAEVRKQNLRDRCDSLIQILHKEPYLIVLDGLERILTAYARMDAPYLKDDDLDEKTLNAVMDAHGYPQGFYQAAVGRHQLRLAADPNVGRFLKQLCQRLPSEGEPRGLSPRDGIPREGHSATGINPVARQEGSRILTSSRLFPADLQLPSGQAIAGCDYLFLQGLSESDSLELWREYGCQGSSEKMLPIFRNFGFHPLVLKVFAGKVANYRLAPGDFDKWHAANPDFKPYGELVQVQSHILQQALCDLSDAERQTLNIIAGFRMAAGIETLQAVLVEGADKVTTNVDQGGDKADKSKLTEGVAKLRTPFRTMGEMDAALTLLEDRGLLGWDRRANRYDLHPIVRGVVWDLVKGDHKQAVCETLRSHFDALPTKEWMEVESLEDLTYAIELYDKLIGLGRYDDAFVVFDDRLDQATLHRLSAAQMRISLLERLFPDGGDQMPLVEAVERQRDILNAVAAAYHYVGRPHKAIEALKQAIALDPENDLGNEVLLGNMALVHRLTGNLYLRKPGSGQRFFCAEIGRIYLLRRSGSNGWGFFSRRKVTSSMANSLCGGRCPFMRKKRKADPTARPTLPSLKPPSGAVKLTKAKSMQIAPGKWRTCNATPATSSKPLVCKERPRNSSAISPWLRSDCTKPCDVCELATLSMKNWQP